jgi:4-amino-4-deoxy-L-arabinose transferase-like glycosyltransferase
MDKPVLSKTQRAVASTITYFALIVMYTAILHYWFGAPGYAVFGFAVALAKIDSVGLDLGRVRARIGSD